MLISVGTKVTFSFSCNGYGWTITLYLPTYSTGFQNELPKARALSAKFDAATNGSTSITYMRLQNASQLRQGIIVPYVSSLTLNLAGVQPQSCAYLRLYNASFTQSKLIFFRGLGNNLVNGGGVLNPASAQGPAIQNCVAQMVADGWSWLGKSNLSLGPQQVTGVVLNANNIPTITFAAPVFNLTANPNQVKYPLSLAGLKGSDTLNGNWVVKPLTSSSCVFTKQVLANPWIAGSGSGYSDIEGLITIGSATTPGNYGLIERFGERKCGRPSYLSRGRSNRKRVVY